MRFSQATFAFYEGLEGDNSRRWWQAHKTDYDAHVAEPLRDLLDQLQSEFGEAKVFRPNRDVRFSKDKSPYKTHQGAYVSVGPALGWYVQVSADGLMTGGGFYHAEPDALKNFRDAVAADGTVLRRLLDDLPRAFETGGETLVRVPRGYDADNPNVGLLRHKTLTIARQYGRKLPANVVTAVGKDWRTLQPIVDWLDGALGG